MKASPLHAQSHHPVSLGSVQKEKDAVAKVADPILAQIRAERGIWGCLKEKLRCKSKFYKLLKKESLEPVPEDIVPYISHILQGLGSKEFIYLRRFLRLMIKKLPSEQCKQLLEEVAKKDNALLISHVLELITLAELETLLPENLTLDELIEAYQSEAENAVPQKKEVKQLCWLLRTLKATLDTLLGAFTFFEIGRMPASTWEASNVLEIYGRIFALPLLVLTALGTILLPLQAVGITALVISIMIIGMIFYVKKLKRMPENVLYGTNLTKAYLQGNLEPVIGRDGDIQKIQSCFAKHKKGALLRPIIVGKTGVGKTALGYGLAQKEKNRVVISINTVDLINDQYVPDSFTKLKRFLMQVEKYKDRYIFIFDEFQAAFANEGKLAKELLSVFDGSLGNLPNCIAVMTDEDYKTHIAEQGAWTRRLHRVEVLPLGEKDTLAILRNMVQMEGMDLEIPEEKIKEIWQDTKDKVQPDAAKKALSLHIASLREEQGKHFDASTLQNELSTLQCELRNGKDPNGISEIVKKINAKTAKIQLLQKKRKKFDRLQKQLSLLKRSYRQEEEKLALLAQTAFAKVRDKKEFVFQKFVKMAVFHQKILNVTEEIKKNQMDLAR